MAKPRPKTGEAREVRQPLKIDKLPIELQDRIRRERVSGRTWMEIEQDSPSWEEWKTAPDAAKELFPRLRLPHSNLQRWYDLRWEQRLREMEAEAAKAKVIADALTARGFKALPDAVKTLLGEKLMVLTSGGNDEEVIAAATDIGHLLVKFEKNDLARQALKTEQKRVQILVDDAERKKRQLEKATNDAAHKLEKGKAITIEDLNRLRERTFGLPPVRQNA